MTEEELQTKLGELDERKKQLQRTRQARLNAEQPIGMLDKLISATHLRKNEIAKELINLHG